MGSFIKNVTFGARDALALARFWASALGTDVDDRPELVVMADPEGNEFCVELGPDDGPRRERPS